MTSAVLIGCFSLACSDPSPEEQCLEPIGRGEASRLARNFVIANGYTLEEPDPSRFVREYPETGTVEQLLAHRRGWVHSEPRDATWDGNRWNVVFAFVPDVARGAGRIVHVGRCGSTIRLGHEQVTLVGPGDAPAKSGGD